ncbi:MAG: cytochrome c3 family protein [Nitrospirota bacterium]
MVRDKGKWLLMAGLVLVLLGCGSGDDGLVSSSGDMTDLTPHTVMTPYFGDPVCARCHTEQGATSSIGLVNGTEGPEEIETILSGMPDIADPSPVACGTCHDRDTGTFLGERAQGLPASWSVQFKTCTACHQLYKADGTTLNTAYHDSWSADKIITDTHWDDPNTDNIEGYVINTSTNHVSGAGNANVGTCLDCHDPHNPAPVRNREWAQQSRPV